jgi:hypothetical protein
MSLIPEKTWNEKENRRGERDYVEVRVPGLVGAATTRRCASSAIAATALVRTHPTPFSALQNSTALPGERQPEGLE